MKIYHWFLVLLCCLTACQNDITDSYTGSILQITGNTYPAFSHATRNQPEMTSFQQGEQIIFFCSGGVSANGIILTFDGKNWIPEIPLKWSGDGTANFTAVYPAMTPGSEGIYDAASLYDKNGSLKDILFCQGNSKQGQNIHLNFSHRFSQLNIQATESVNKKIENTVCITNPVSSFNPYSGNITQQTSESHEENIKQNEKGLYSFIVPPSDDIQQDITITFHMKDNSLHTNTISGKTLKPGTAYGCNVTSQGDLPGIYTAEDFIAFSHLINGEEYEGRTLDEFGETIDGKTTYYLRSDIEFTEEESEKVMTIGNGNLVYAENAFTETFDGLGYTLSNITLHKKTNYTTDYGIFGAIGLTGIIKNLRLTNIIYTQNEKVGYVGLLAGLNDGQIYNCSLTNSSLNLNGQESTSEDFGGLIGYNNNHGIVYNCQIDNVTLQAKEKNWSSAGICKSNYGCILNCSATNINIKTLNSGAYICYNNNNEIENCYVYKSSEKKYHAICKTNHNKAKINYCYYPDNFTSKPISTNNSLQQTDVQKYDSDTFTVGDDNEPLHERLNRWIDEVGSKEYPELEFLRWEKGENIPAVLIMP